MKPGRQATQTNGQQFLDDVMHVCCLRGTFAFAKGLRQEKKSSLGGFP